MKAGTIVVMHKEGEAWVPVLPAEVPRWLTNPDVLGTMVTGVEAQLGGDVYRAVLVGECPLELPEKSLARA